MRPKPIVWFELLMIAGILIGLAEAVVGWRGYAAQYQSISSRPDWVAALVVGLTFGLVLLLTLLASRLRNGAALVLLILLFLGGLPQIVRKLIVAGIDGAQPLPLLGLVIDLLAFALALTAPSRRWFSARVAAGKQDRQANLFSDRPA